MPRRLPVLLLALAPLWAQDSIRFGDTGYTDYGEWSAEAIVNPGVWTPGTTVTVSAALHLTQDHLAKLTAAGIAPDGACLLVTAERTFDATGWLRLASDERMSTLVTPAGLPIEGGVQGAVTNRFGYGFRTPVDQFQRQPFSVAEDGVTARFVAQERLPQDLPPGLYRVRLDFGVTAGRRRFNLNAQAFAKRPFFKGRPTESHLYSPPLRAGDGIQPRIPWVLLGNYNSNGYRGVVADEDKSRFAISGRNLIQDDVILPLARYSLEPQFPADTIEERSNIPWDYTQGELSVKVTAPDGKITDLGTAPFTGKLGMWPTTRKPAFTQWRPAGYGYYTVLATGWIADIWGNRYEGGGTYHFWIANRMTLATATFQGMPYPVGSRYGRDIAFAPAVPADVEVHAVLYVNSDPNQRREMNCSGKASPGGIFSAAQGLKQLALDAPGEYSAHILARYTDSKGQLWVCSMRHAGVVYPEDSPIAAHGKKISAGGKLLDRGETHVEGWVDTATDEPHLAHINFPYQPGDVLLIASEGQGANKIEPVLTYERKESPAPYDARLQGIGVTNVRLETSNGYSPHLFPEYITTWAYYYASAPRPGFVSRFLVAEDGTRAPYWPTSPNSFGGQINASSNGDLPGDIYRLIGGVVLRRPDEPPAYAGYIASAFLLPKGTNNNRVIAPGSEDLTGSTGEKARFFLVGTRPGMVYETGTTFLPAMQIDPILPVNITFTLEYPDGRQVVAAGAGDKFGSFVGKDRWTLDVAGIYRYHLEAEWQGHRGFMPGLPKSGGEFYVLETDRPANAPKLTLNLPEFSTFRPDAGLEITGSSTATSVYFAAVIPGAVIDQGTLTVTGGKFHYYFDPKLIHQHTPTYDIANRVTGRPDIKDVVHLTFLSKEGEYHSFARVILRGTAVIYTH